MNGKQLIKIGGVLLGIGAAIGYAAYMQIKKEQESLIVLDSPEIDILEAQAEDDSRR